LEAGHPREKLAFLKTWVLDTSPIVAYLDADDLSHALVVEAFNGFAGEFVTTSAVVGETMYFVSALHGGPESFVAFLESSRTKVVDYCQPNELKSAVRLMQKYADTPMDFADATLILLGDAMRLTKICTLDRRGFSTYRTASGKRFHLVLEDFAT
jgi:predicted nucleic acid-binding protein